MPRLLDTAKEHSRPDSEQLPIAERASAQPWRREVQAGARRAAWFSGLVFHEPWSVFQKK
jgi:hypothetical protein